MALSFTRFSWWWLAGNEKEQVSSGSSINSINSLSDWGLGLRGEPEGLKFQSVKGRSESDDSDWSIGWLEPHAPDFQSDDDADDSFAVLVPCYRLDCKELEGKEEETGNQFLSAIRNLPNQYSVEGKKYMEQWLSSLNNY
ncbi:hypothetical protein Fot_04945 [Forsythia ovata]|uniref:Uncharacterized protein n=1 Tax=Forsythia ovata TaxID=205694 RepID=A0ABD1WNR3_9LAMI